MKPVHPLVYEHAFCHAPLPMAILDTQGVVIDINDQFIETYGYSRAELPTMAAWWKLTIPDPALRQAVVADRAEAIESAALTGIPTPPSEYKVTCKSGDVRTAVLSSFRAGDLRIATFVDVTERRAAEDAVRSSAKLYRETLEHMLEGCQIVGFDYRYRYVNVSAAVHNRVPAEDLIGRTMMESFPGIDATEVFAKIRTCMEERVVQHSENEFVFSDGSVGFFHVHVLPVPEGVAIFTDDLTARRQVESALQTLNADLERRVDERTADLVEARAAAEASSESKTRFLANMSHEIRTPLNAIIGLTHLIQTDCADPSQQDRLGHVAQAADHLLSVINDILDLAKIEAGMLELDKRDFSLRETLEGIRSLVSNEAQKKGLRFVIEEPSVPDALRGDAARLSQALLNLVSNAVKFTGTGEVRIQVDEIERSAESLSLQFIVRDSGVGIDPTAMDRLFKAFSQADPSTTRRFGGTGLGLAITRRLAELMDGSVSAESKPGFGSVFKFTARFEQSDAPTVPAAPAATPEAELRHHFPGARVLLVEDNPINQFVAQNLLVDVGLKVTTAETGFQAIALADAEPFDIILMDMQMPIMDGLEATRRIRGILKHATTPVIAMTANAFAEDRAACLAAGMNDHLSKPVRPSVLYAAILHWLRG